MAPLPQMISYTAFVATFLSLFGHSATGCAYEIYIPKNEHRRHANYPTNNCAKKGSWVQAVEMLFLFKNLFLGLLSVVWFVTLVHIVVNTSSALCFEKTFDEIFMFSKTNFLLENNGFIGR